MLQNLFLTWRCGAGPRRPCLCHSRRTPRALRRSQCTRGRLWNWGALCDTSRVMMHEIVCANDGVE